MELLLILLFPLILLVVSVLFIYCFYRKCQQERAAGGAQAVVRAVSAFVAPANVPEWVTTPVRLVHHYYMSSMYSLVSATALRYPDVPPIGQIELGVV